jgi:hypothetical protein
MRLTAPAGIAMGAGVLAVALFASTEDDYYGDGTTHWGHATKDGGTEALVALFAIPTAVALAFIVLGLLRRSASPLWGIPAFAVYGLTIWYAYALLAGGH